MRRMWIVVGLIGISSVGCGKAKELFTSGPEVAARAGGAKLTADQLSKLMLGARGTPASKETAQFIANLWIDYSLYAEAVAKGTVKTDSAAVAAALWPQIAEARGQEFHDSILARHANATADRIDSLYNSDVRVLQHVLVMVPQGADNTVRSAAKAKADSIDKVAKGGADFGALAMENSQDPGSGRDGGYLPPSKKGSFVPEFEKAGWALAPGQVSPVVQTNFGYHVIRRPTKAEVEARLGQYLAMQVARQIDSVYMDSLGKANKLEVSKDAPAAIKTALADPSGQAKSTKAIATYTGGTVTVGEMLHWLQALPPQLSAQLSQAQDDQLANFAKALSNNILLLKAADAAGVKLGPAQWDAMKKGYLENLDSLKASLGLSGVTNAKDAAAKVTAYFDELVSGKTRLVQVPPPLAGQLRAQGDWKVNPAGIARTVELVTAAKAKDSTAAKPAPGPGMQPAPGPAPVPGEAAPAPAPAPAPGAQPKP